VKKIPTLFVRDPEDRSRVLDQITPGCEWVMAGEGRPTVKWDGTCVMLDENGRWWARREVKPGKQPPPGYLVVQHDEVTGKTVGWEPVHQSPFEKYFVEAYDNSGGNTLTPGTYELVGPKINSRSSYRPDYLPVHLLMQHGWTPLSARLEAGATPLTFTDLRELMRQWPYEGIVWHHPRGDMAKLKRCDFGF